MKGEWVRGIDEDIWKVKYVIVIGINKQGGGGKDDYEGVLV